MTDLGVLGTSSSAVSLAYALNNQGQIVGESDQDVTAESSVRRAFVWLPGPDLLGFSEPGMHDLELGLLPGENPTSKAYDINDSGFIVGATSRFDPGHAFLWLPAEWPAMPGPSGRGMRDLGCIAPYGISEARGISNIQNSVVHVAGWSDALMGRSAGFVWSSGTPSVLTDLPQPPAPPGAPVGWDTARAYAINPHIFSQNTRIAGDASNFSNLGPNCEDIGEVGAIGWEGAQFHRLDMVAFNNSYGVARDTNDDGNYVGYADELYLNPTECRTRAAFWPTATSGFVNLHTAVTPAFPPDQETQAEAMTNNGSKVVGWNETTDEALLWEFSGGAWSVANLNDLISPNAPLGLVKAYDINTVNGETWIVGVGDADPGIPVLEHAFVLTPVGTAGCPADVVPDGTIDVLDLLLVLAQWDCTTGTICTADVNFDGTVNVFDLLDVLAAWGPCGRPPEPIPEDIQDCLDKFMNDPIALQACIEAVSGALGGQ